MGQTDFLFSMPSFINGAASVLDVGSTLTQYNESSTGEEADAKALFMDWRVVGDVIRGAVQAYGRK